MSSGLSGILWKDVFIQRDSHSETGPSERGGQLKSSRPRGPGKPLVYSALGALDRLPGKATAETLLEHARLLRYIAAVNARLGRPFGEDGKERVELAITLPPYPAWAKAQTHLRWLHMQVMRRPHVDYTATLNEARKKFDQEFRNEDGESEAFEPVPPALDREINAILKRRRRREKMEADRFARELGNLPVLDPLNQARTIARWRHRMRTSRSHWLDAELALYAPRPHRRNRPPSAP